MWRPEAALAPGLGTAAGRPLTVGWDVGGAHLKACRMEGDRRVDVAQWICPLWQGPGQLEAALDAATARWPDLAAAQHAVTMTGEMADGFVDRADGVARIAAALEQRWPHRVRLFAGEQDWLLPAEAAQHWERIASANWRATAAHCAQHFADRSGLLIDIGSTTSDLIAFRHGRLLGESLSDRDRLRSGELVYLGVVRTPLCALAERIAFQGESLNVMNELFATTADVFRLLGELDPSHDLYPGADGADKSLAATRARLARMVGCDAREGSEADWLRFAQAWRNNMLDRLATELQRMVSAQGLDLRASAVVVAGAGAFLVPDLIERTAQRLGLEQAAPGWKIFDYGFDVAGGVAQATDHGCIPGARLCAPSVAVAALWQQAARQQRTAVEQG